MPAAYDNYNYPDYWEGRNYEHSSEVIALKHLLAKIPKIGTILDIGAGYGRLTSLYTHRAKKIILVDPSAKLLKLAREKNPSKKINILQSTIENLKGKVKNKSVDLIILIRVIHHIKDFDQVIAIISKLSRKNSYFILEYPNKRHMKETFLQFLKGNLTFPLDIFPKDLSSKKSIRQGALPFVNYHPDFIKESLTNHGFKILSTLSVSNLRYTWFKDNLPTDFVLFLERWLQRILAPFNFGPSIFVLAKKRTNS